MGDKQNKCCIYAQLTDSKTSYRLGLMLYNDTASSPIDALILVRMTFNRCFIIYLLTTISPFITTNVCTIKQDQIALKNNFDKLYG